MEDFKGKLALVSAASSGIGKGIATVLASKGCRIHIFSRNEEKIKSVAAEIHAKTGSEITYSAGDMTRIEDIKRVISEMEQKAGVPDFLVINYGDPKIAPFLDLSEEDWSSAVNMILMSSVVMARAFLPEMMKKNGRIVFVTSLTTKQPMQKFALSASLRSAVVALSKVISLEYSGTGITSNSISQGFIQTPRLDAVAENNSKAFNISVPEAMEKIRESIPSKKIGTPEDIGNLVSFLCSKEASYVNGTNIQIDGGAVLFPF